MRKTKDAVRAAQDDFMMKLGWGIQAILYSKGLKMEAGELRASLSRLKDALANEEREDRAAIAKALGEGRADG